MDGTLLLKFVCAFIFVIGLMMFFAWFMKKVGLANPAFAPSGRRRLKIIEMMALDHRRRLVLVQRDNVQHLLVLGPENETVIETNIPATETPADTASAKETQHV
jgi:flagellar protein FliO/FliZ